MYLQVTVQKDGVNHNPTPKDRPIGHVFTQRQSHTQRQAHGTRFHTLRAAHKHAHSLTGHACLSSMLRGMPASAVRPGADIKPLELPPEPALIDVPPVSAQMSTHRSPSPSTGYTHTAHTHTPATPAPAVPPSTPASVSWTCRPCWVRSARQTGPRQAHRAQCHWAQRCRIGQEGPLGGKGLPRAAQASQSPAWCVCMHVCVPVADCDHHVNLILTLALCA